MSRNTSGLPHEVSANLVGKTINDVLDVMWREVNEVIGMNIRAYDQVFGYLRNTQLRK